MKKFTINENHLKLLRSAYVGWNGCEFGAPSIECKRPYGNSDVYTDIAKIIGLPLPDEEKDEEFTDTQFAEMDKLHKETETVLQIILTTGEFSIGEYVADDYSQNWKRKI